MSSPVDLHSIAHTQAATVGVSYIIFAFFTMDGTNPNR